MTDDGELIHVTTQIDGTDLERLVVIGDDLRFLSDLPRDRLPTHTEVRLCAGILRRLLVDRQLEALWRSIDAPKDAPLTVEAIDLDTPLSNWPHEWIKYAWAGGASFGGAHHTGMILAAIPAADMAKYGSVDALMEANPMPQPGQRQRMTLDHWLRTTCVAIQTDAGLVPISRRRVLRYVANRKGGVHYDPTRNLQAKDPRQSQEDYEFMLLDLGLLRVGHLDGPEFEVASLVRSILDSQWAPEIMRMATEVAPEWFVDESQTIRFWSGLREADGTGWATLSGFDSAAAQ